MTDFERIAEIYSAFSQSLRDISGENKPSARDPIEMLRVDYWYEGLKQRTGLKSAYALELHFEKDSFQRNSNGTIRHYRSKWSRYEQNLISPKAKTLKRVEPLAPGSTHELNHPLWTLMRLVDKHKHIDFDMYLRTLSIDIQAVLLSAGFSGLSVYSKREPVTQLLLDKLERRASLDSLACLIAIVLEANEKNQRPLAIKAVHTIHNVLLMISIELQSRAVAIRLLDWIITNILPLGVMPHLRVWMDSSDYIHASAHLSSMVYQSAQRRGKCLEWKQRTKVMGRLIHGGMGLDVEYAMRPQFELREDIGEIPADLIEEFNQTSELRTWGWTCILEGRSEPFPPADLFKPAASRIAASSN